ncbi:MAG: DNA-protecting protein DprA [bacterium]|nr:DNA-protecting protein DprA [bacterium]
MESSELVRSYLRLTLADGVGAVTFGRLIQAFGNPAAVIDAGPGKWRQVDGVGPKKVDAITSVSDDLIDRELEEADRRGVKIICLSDPSYPAGLKTIYDPPPVLYVWGELTDVDAIALGVVGARRCTHYGLEQADRFGRMLARAGFTVVSGGARGIDTACHQGSLSAGGRTVAVMGCGLSEFYPPENAKLFERIVADGTGALISEIPMGRGVESRNFPKRNRIISGLSLGVLIVEAADRSGSLITARQAAEQGREVFALPGRVDSPMSYGSNALIRDGAILVQNLDDILEHLGHVAGPMSGSEDAPPVIPTNLDANETRIVKELAQGSMSLDEITARTELATGTAAAAMTMLVLKGVVAQKPGNVFVLKRR